MLQIKRLSVKNGRGIVNGPDLHFGSGGVLVCGDNGTGKSSYVDALEKVLTGKCSSLDIGAQGLSWRQQGGHILAEADPEIELEITDGNQTHVVNLKSSPSSCPRPLKPLLQASHDGGFILRRRTLLNFIDAKPADRWKAVEAILNVAQFQEFEQELIALNRTFLEEIEKAAEYIQSNENQIRGHLGIEPGTPINETSCIRYLNETIRSLSLTKISSLKEAKTASAAVQQHLAAFSNMEKWQKFLQFSEFLKKSPVYQELIAALAAYAANIRSLDEESKKLAGQFYGEVLKRGLQWIQEDRLENCPLCGSRITFDEVQSYVNQRLEEHSTIVELKASQIALHAELTEKLREHAEFLDGVHEYLESGCTSLHSARFEEFRENIHTIRTSYASPQTDITKVQADLGLLQEQNGAAILTSMQQEIDKTCTASPDVERYKELYQLNWHLQTVPVHLDNIRHARKLINSYEFCQAQVAQICALATQARKNSIQILMEAISKTAHEYYQFVHPGESIGSPEILVKQRANASLELKSDFYGRSGDPRGHYSEGHVDSLGLCIFLAIRRFQFQHSPDVALLVLDDVLHSVDGNHRRATAEMIFEKFGDHQIFITTHDPIWFEYLKSASRRHMNGKKFEHYKISQWTLEGGPIFGDHLNDYEWLVSERCCTASPQDRAIKAGRLLEAMLQELCHNLVISVPYNKSGNYTLDPLWSAFRKKALKFSSFKEALPICLEKIEKTRQLRNWTGAHWNAWAQGITAKEAQEFCDGVIDLRKLVYCDTCGQFIKRIADLDGVWACKNQHLKYERR